MDKVLLVYGSGEGQTAKIARHIASLFREEGLEVDLIRGDEIIGAFSIKGYAGILVAASIHEGKHQKYIVKFVKDYLPELAGKPSAFISISVSAAAKVPKLKELANGYFDTFVKETGWKPQKYALVGGALQYTKYSLFKKIMLRLVTRNSLGPTNIRRDYEFTDWGQVEQFSKEVLESFKRVAIPVN
jgi:menaquinone-dependent protoporphyrinogen oxidase